MQARNREGNLVQCQSEDARPHCHAEPIRRELTNDIEPGFPGLVFLLARELRAALDRRMDEHGLTLQQAQLLIRCGRNKGASAKALMPHLGTDEAGVSRLIDRLEAAGFVERHARKDRRSMALEPTKRGASLVPKLEDVFKECRKEFLGGLTRTEIEEFERLARRVLANAKMLEVR
jgi:MarR family multiple antibiotic resistance transcriptional regulator